MKRFERVEQMSLVDFLIPDSTMIVDVYNLAFRSWYAQQRLNQPGKHPIAHIFGSLRSLASLRRKTDAQYLHFVTEGYPKYRHSLLPEYKQNRPGRGGGGSGGSGNAAFSVANVPHEVCQVLKLLPGQWHHHPDEEADDVIASLIPNLETTGSCWVISSDRDLWALADQQVTVLGNRQRRFDPEQIELELGVPPERVELYKAFFGDPSDNIKGVPRIRRKFLLPLIQRSDSVESVYDKLFSGTYDTGLAKHELLRLKEHQPLVEKNYQVVKLHRLVRYTTQTFPGQRDLLDKLVLEIDCPTLIPALDVLFR